MKPKVVDKVWSFHVQEAESKTKLSASGVSGGSDWVSYYSEFIHEIRTNYFPIDSEDSKQRKLLKRLETSAHFNVLGGHQFDITLQTLSHKTKVRIELPSFLLLGYQMEMEIGKSNNSDDGGQWLEFGAPHNVWRGHPPLHDIPGSSFLEFQRSYSCILRQVGGGHTLYTFPLGQQPLIHAVNLLATSFSSQERAFSLLVIKVMICEAVRFSSISKFFCNTFPAVLPLCQPLVDLIFYSPTAHVMSLATKLHRSPLFIEDNVRFPDMDFQLGFVENAEALTHLPMKRPVEGELLEVFSLQINDIDEEKKNNSSGNFFGTISSIDSRYAQHIYNRGRDDIEFIRSGENLLLTGPSSCIPADDSDGFVFGIGDDKNSFIVPQIHWDSTTDEFDKPFLKEFANDDCSMTLSFIAFGDAVQATVEVTIFAAAHVYLYGKISACSSEYVNDHEIVLFQKMHKDRLEVSPGEQLKLSRSTVAVPMDSSLIIQVELNDYYTECDFVLGYAEFPAKFFGSSKKKIYGYNSSKIQVKVTWT